MLLDLTFSRTQHWSSSHYTVNLVCWVTCSEIDSDVMKDRAYVCLCSTYIFLQVNSIFKCHMFSIISWIASSCAFVAVAVDYFIVLTFNWISTSGISTKTCCMYVWTNTTDAVRWQTLLPPQRPSLLMFAASQTHFLRSTQGQEALTLTLNRAWCLSAVAPTQRCADSHKLAVKGKVFFFEGGFLDLLRSLLGIFATAALLHYDMASARRAPNNIAPFNISRLPSSSESTVVDYVCECELECKRG